MSAGGRSQPTFLRQMTHESAGHLIYDFYGGIGGVSKLWQHNIPVKI